MVVLAHVAMSEPESRVIRQKAYHCEAPYRDHHIILDGWIFKVALDIAPCIHCHGNISGCNVMSLLMVRKMLYLRATTL